MKQKKVQLVKYKGRYYKYENLKNGQLRLDSKTHVRPLDFDVVEFLNILLTFGGFFQDLFKVGLPFILSVNNKRYGLTIAYREHDRVMVSYDALDDINMPSIFSAIDTTDKKARKKMKAILKNNNFMD